jgi:hypothetical protein
LSKKVFTHEPDSLSIIIYLSLRVLKQPEIDSPLQGEKNTKTQQTIRNLVENLKKEGKIHN